MNIDFNKVINFLCGKDVPEFSLMLKTLVNVHFIMDSVLGDKIILLDNSTHERYLLSYSNDRLLITREDTLSLNDNFGFIMEISSSNGIVTLSNIFNIATPEGIMSTTSKYKYDNGFNFVSGRMCLLKENVLSSLTNKQNINQFLSSFYEKRTSKFNDLYWDMDLLRKSLLIDSYVTRDISLNNSNDFNAIYKDLLTQIINTMKELV